MVVKIEELPDQICFPSEDGQTMICNWVKHPKKIGYAIASKLGKWIPFPIAQIKKSGEKNVEQEEKNKPLAGTKDLKQRKLF